MRQREKIQTVLCARRANPALTFIRSTLKRLYKPASHKFPCDHFLHVSRTYPIKSEASHSKHRKLDREYLSLFAVRTVARSVMDGCHGAIWKGLSVEFSGLLCCAVIPKTNYIFHHRLISARLKDGDPFRLYFADLICRRAPPDARDSDSLAL
jgi:hypothetical protein